MKLKKQIFKQKHRLVSLKGVLLCLILIEREIDTEEKWLYMHVVVGCILKLIGNKVERS